MRITPKRAACAALCVLLLMSLTVIPVGAVDSRDHAHEAVTEVAAKPGLVLAPAAEYKPEICNGRHSWVNGTWVKTKDVGLEACFGECEAFYVQCSVCGARQYTVFRGSVSEAIHDFTEDVTLSGGCEKNPFKEKHCTVCGQTVTTGGEHDWVKGELKHRERCTDYDTQTYRCEKCGETKTENAGERGAHKFVEKTTNATCDEPGYTYLECSVCRYVTAKVRTQDPLGHQWDNCGCESERHCSRCGTTLPAQGHSYSGQWQSDKNGHWKICPLCGKRLNEGGHTYANGVCTVCGMSNPQTLCKHESWTYTYNGFGSFSHTKTCTSCGYSVREGCSDSTADYDNRTDCTQPLYCKCGNKISEGQKRHNFGTYICHDDTHEHKCLNRGCDYGTVEHHNVVYVAGVAKCSVCGFVLKALSAPHTHTFGTWMAGEAGCVQHCTDPTCEAVNTAAHQPGAADCTGSAVCVTCGAAVKTAPGATHVGPTEIRNAVPAEVGKAGYTGDTVCVACGKVVAQGRTIEALKPSHVHAFDTLAHDSTGHWKVCACGEHEAVTGHTGGTATCTAQAVCAVCGEKYGELSAANHVGGTRILNAAPAEVGKAGYTGDVHCQGCGALLERGTQIPALTPAHTHSYTLRSDSAHHWRECDCGDRQETADHAYTGGVCAVCGEREPETAEVHVHTISARWEADGSGHWHTCASCGTVCDKAEHLFVDGKCQCGMSYFAYERKKANEAHPAPPVTQVFADIPGDPAGDYYVPAIQRLYEAGIMSGSGNALNVNGSISNVELQLVLARISGVEGTYDPDWAAVKKAVNAWAAEHGYLTGENNAPATREEVIFNLWLLAGSPKSTRDLSVFADADAVKAEHLEAVRWAVEKGILTGSGRDGKLYIAPADPIRRKDAATIVVRYVDAANIII